MHESEKETQRRSRSETTLSADGLNKALRSGSNFSLDGDRLADQLLEEQSHTRSYILACGALLTSK